MQEDIALGIPESMTVCPYKKFADAIARGEGVKGAKDSKPGRKSRVTCIYVTA